MVDSNCKNKVLEKYGVLLEKKSDISENSREDSGEYVIPRFCFLPSRCFGMLNVVIARSSQTTLADPRFCAFAYAHTKSGVIHSYFILICCIMRLTETVFLY